MMQTFLFLFFVHLAKSTFVPVVEEGYQHCEGDSGLKPFLDTSELEVIQTDDTNSVLNGKLKVLVNIVQPFQFYFATERFDRGQWVPGELMRKVVDFCEAFHNPAEAWSALAKHFKNTRCPVKAGTVLKFDMLSLSNFNISLPPAFAGQWRILIKLATGVPPVRDCVMFNFDIVEV